MKKRMVVKKITMLVLLVVIFAFCRRGIGIFPLYKVFPLENFLAEKMDVQQMLDETFKEASDELTREWNKHIDIPLQIEAVPVPGSISFNEADTVIYLLYGQEVVGEKKMRKFLNFQMSDRAINLLIETGNKICRDESYTRETFVRGLDREEYDLREIAMFGEKEYENLKQEFPEMKYSMEEMQVLLANGLANLLVHSFVHITEKECQLKPFLRSMPGFKMSRYDIINKALSSYAPYFYKKNKWVCWKAALVQKIWTTIFLVGAFFLLLNLLSRRDLIDELEAEIKKRQLKDFRISFWEKSELYFFFFTLPSIKKEEIQWRVDEIEEKEKEEKEKRQFKKITQEAEKIWEELPEKDRHAQDLFDSAIGKGSFSARVSALNKLKRLLVREKMEGKFSDSISVPIEARSVYVRKNGEKKRQVEKEVLIQEIKASISAEFFDRIESLSFQELENLTLVLDVLDELEISGDDFLGRVDFRELLKSKSSFMSAIRFRKDEEVQKMLNVKNIDKGEQAKELKHKALPQNLWVTIVCGGLTLGRKDDLIRAVKELGPKWVDFCDAEKGRQIEGLCKSKVGNRLIIQTTSIPHKYGRMIDASGIRTYFVHAKSREAFQRELLEMYYNFGSS